MVCFEKAVLWRSWHQQPRRPGGPRAPPHRAAAPRPQPELLEREEGCSCAGERVHRCSTLYCTPTPAPRGESSKFLLALEEEGEMGLEQVRSGTSQPSSSSAESFAGGSYGHG